MSYEAMSFYEAVEWRGKSWQTNFECVSKSGKERFAVLWRWSSGVEAAG
jgi:hypothetical protein